MLLFINVQRVAHLALMAVAFIYIVYVTANLFTSRQSPMYAIAALSMTSFLWLLWHMIGFQYFKFVYKRHAQFELTKKTLYSFKFDITK